jgi:D-ribose pyranase
MKIMFTFKSRFNKIYKFSNKATKIIKMKEVGLINRSIARVVVEQGHQDLLMVVDAGFAIPSDVEVIDLSLKENSPMVLEVLAELQKFHSVEKLILAQQTKETNPTLFKDILKVWGDDTGFEVIEHAELKQLAKTVKAVIRTGDFTAFGNVILVSGAGNRWYCENTK